MNGISKHREQGLEGSCDANRAVWPWSRQRGSVRQGLRLPSAWGTLAKPLLTGWARLCGNLRGLGTAHVIKNRKAEWFLEEVKL